MPENRIFANDSERLLALGHALEYLAAIVSEGGSDPANVFQERGVTFELRPERATEGELCRQQLSGTAASSPAC